MFSKYLIISKRISYFSPRIEINCLTTKNCEFQCKRIRISAEISNYRIFRNFMSYSNSFYQFV